MPNILKIIALFTVSTLTSAGPIFYTVESDFDADIASNNINLTTDDFEGIANDFDGYWPGIGFRYDGPSGLNFFSDSEIFREPNSDYCVNNSNCINFETTTRDKKNFSFDSGPVNAFGLIIGDYGTVGNSTLTLFTSTGDSQSWYFPNQEYNNKKFFGIIDTSRSFVSVSLTADSYSDIVNIDNVRWGSVHSVSEPASLTILGLGLAIIGFTRKACKA